MAAHRLFDIYAISKISFFPCREITGRTRRFVGFLSLVKHGVFTLVRIVLAR